MRKSNFALRLQPSLAEGARRMAESEGVSLNQFINVAVAEKLAAMRSAGAYFEARKERGTPGLALGILRDYAGDVPGEEDGGVALRPEKGR